jgi:uncharacterized protein YPO0396
MMTLAKVRIVNWHYFSDETIPIGNLCLFTGDNGSGKTTIVDAIQYALAADLRKARFNAATGDRKGGRDLAGYARCKLGTDQTDYLRGDAVAHVMLSFTREGGPFTAGVSVEAFTDGRTNEKFWIAENVDPSTVVVRDPSSGRQLPFRQFRDALAPRGAEFYDSKKAYLRELTAKLGVFRRMAEYNPYLESFTRSVSFMPLDSVNRFVCDYILEERPLDVSAMKANLESYKEAEREAHATKRRIASLTKIAGQAAEYEGFLRVLKEQDYLKALIERSFAQERRQSGEDRVANLERRILSLDEKLRSFAETRASLETARRETETALARDDIHLLYERTGDRLAAIEKRQQAEQAKADRYGILTAQCAALIGAGNEEETNFSDAADIESSIARIDAETNARSGECAISEREKENLEGLLRETLAELSDLDRGIKRYPENAGRLRDELVSRGIDARILADLAEVTQEVWADAVEGWLNTLRFAVIVQPDDFQKALEAYDALPRSISGVALPNIGKMRNAEVRKGSLAELVTTDSPYAGYYLSCVLGDVMTADITTLKNYSKSITKDCMCYSRYTASRIDEKVYRDHWLGRSALEKRKTHLLAESARLRGERDRSSDIARIAGERVEILRRVSRALSEALGLFPSVAESSRLAAEYDAVSRELAAIDVSEIRELEARIADLAERMTESDRELAKTHSARGAAATELESARTAVDEAREKLEIADRGLAAFVEEHASIMASCEKYAAERLRAQSPREIMDNFESARKGIDSKAQSGLRAYREFVQRYDNEFNALLSSEIDQSAEARSLLERLESSELPEYLEKITRARMDAEREFKDHFISRLNELIEEARESFREINEILRSMTFGRDQYRFTLSEREDRRGQIEIVRKASEIANFGEGLFTQLEDPADREAAEALFDRILHADLDSAEMRSVCDYRTYFTYDIRTRDTQSIDPSTGKAPETSLARVLREKSGGESQTPYYVAIAASFYRFFKDRPESTIRLVLFDEAFDRLDDERIGKVLEFYREMGLQLVVSVPTEKIEAIAPRVDRTNIVIRHGHSARVRDFATIAAQAES